MPAKPLLLLVSVLAVLLAGCSRGPTASEPAPPELRTYDVPAGQAEALAEALNHVLDGQGENPDVGKATARLSGRLLVLAPASVQDSVELALEEMIASALQDAPSPITLHLWLVDAQPGPDDTTGLDASIAPALETARERFPGMGLRLVESASLSLPSVHTWARLATGAGSNIHVRTLPGSAPTFDVEFTAPPREGQAALDFNSRIEMATGETVIAATLNKGPSAAAGSRLILLRLEPSTR